MGIDSVVDYAINIPPVSGLPIAYPQHRLKNMIRNSFAKHCNGNLFMKAAETGGDVSIC